jgi:hypothetical protein
MADEVGVKTDSTGLSNKSSSLVTSSTSSADGEHSKRATPPSVTQGGARDRSMSVGGAELGALRRVASKGALVEDTRAPELLAFEDMTLREHYKVSEKLFEVRRSLWGPWFILKLNCGRGMNWQRMRPMMTPTPED